MFERLRQRFAGRRSDHHVASSSGGVPVSVFNSQTAAVNVIVNGAPSFAIPGTSTAIEFIPQVPAASVAPTFSLLGPGQNVFGPGTNYVSVSPTGTVVTKTFEVSLSSSIQYISLQVYVFSNGADAVTLAVLQNGQLLMTLT